MYSKIVGAATVAVILGGMQAYADMVRLVESQAPALIGVWQGDYVCNTGYRGRSSLTLTSHGGDGSVRGFFEYRYGGGTGGRTDRYPNEGTITGIIKPDGKLHFGSWDLTLGSQGGDGYTFTTRQSLGGYPCALTWRRSGVNLAAAARSNSDAGHRPAVPGAPPSVPLPRDVDIVPPGPDVASDVAAFSGAWYGVWDGKLDHVLIVEKITPKHVRTIYANGDAPSRGVTPGFNHPVQSFFNADALVLELARPATVTYRMQNDGTLAATYQWRGGTMAAALQRLESASAPPATSVVAGDERFALAGLDVPGSVQAGEFYTIEFRYDGAEAPSIKQVCFPAATGAANCWDSFIVDLETKTIRTSSRIGAPGTYTLTGYVAYEENGSTLESNQVSTQVTVR